MSDIAQKIKAKRQKRNSLLPKGKPPRVRRCGAKYLARTPEIKDALSHAEYQASVQALPGYEKQALEFFKNA